MEQAECKVLGPCPQCAEGRSAVMSDGTETCTCTLEKFKLREGRYPIWWTLPNTKPS